MSQLSKLSGREVLSRTPKEKVKKRMRSKQRAVTALEKSVWDRMCCEVGCIACWSRGIRNFQVSVHHIDGRTKPDCHKLVLPICAGHHQDGTGPDKTMVAIHPYKTRFESLYGPQKALLWWILEELQLNADFTPIV